MTSSSKKARGRKAREAKPAANTGRFAPSNLSEDTHRHYDSAFVPIRLTKQLREHKGVQLLLTFMEEDGPLELWELGRKGTHISSHFITTWGKEDYLTSPFADDDDYGSLVDAHIWRFLDLAGLKPKTLGPRMETLPTVPKR